MQDLYNKYHHQSMHSVRQDNGNYRIILKYYRVIIWLKKKIGKNWNKWKLTEK